jgi:AGZA family xanthine/uracil permease-like MFS transporter
MGSLTSPTAIVAIVSILLAVILTAVKLKGALIISIITATIVGIPLGVTVMPTDLSFAPDFSSFGAPFQMTSEGTMAIVQLVLQPALLMFVFSLLMSDFFDTVGTVVAVGSQADFVDKEGNVEDVKEILIVDSAAAAVGGLAGASSITSYIESVSGVAAGARTGLSNIVVGLAFILFAFLAPVVGMVSFAATCGALVVVGYLMMSEIKEIDWSDIALAFPAFITIIGIPLTYSITNGIGLGFISYCIIKTAQGKAKDVKPLMWVAAAAFLATFIFA